MKENGLLEQLAALECDRWRYQTDSLLKSLRNIGRSRDPQLHKLVNQIGVPYKRLRESEKEIHRQWARKILEVISEKSK